LTPKSRRCKHWLKSIGHLTRNTEAPTHFWLWSGIFTICAALERKVWIPYGLDRVYPNLYLMLVAPPGKCRKGGPVGLSKRLLKTIGCTVSVDSCSKESLTSEISDCLKRVDLPGVGMINQSPFAVISKELSSLLAVDAKKMIEALTDLFDEHDVWEYKTKHGKEEKLYGPCVSMFAATTPYYIANNLPYEAFGAGFFSRVVFVVGKEKKKRVAIPEDFFKEEDVLLLESLEKDLNLISHLRGPITWSEGAKALFTKWYNNLDSKYEEVKDERFHGFIERAHIVVLKVATAVRVSYSDLLFFEEYDIATAIELVEDLFPNLQGAFGGLGRSDTSISTNSVIQQLKILKEVKLSQLISDNWRNMDMDEMRSVLSMLYSMGNINRKIIQTKDGRPDERITWTGKD